MSLGVLIVEDDAKFRDAFARAVQAAGDMQLLGTADDLSAGLAALDTLRPDVLLVDLGLPGGSGISLIRHASSTLPHCDSMVVTVFGDEQHVLAAIEAGATGYLLKDTRPSDVAEQIRVLCAGGSPISPVIARRLLTRFGAAPAPGAAVGAQPGDATLSAQERQVLTLSAKGYSYDEIARLMAVSRHTVTTYVKRSYRKLQVHSKTEAVYEARRLGLVDD
jgi:DNA-binding NarL/FixJ family response regulator